MTEIAAVLLVAHGSADPRAAATTRSLARAVAATRPGLDVRVSFLDHAGPRPGPVLRELQGAGYRHVVVVPLLLTAAYHLRVDLPAVLAGLAGLDLEVTVGDPLGPVDGVIPPLLLGALRRRLSAATPQGYDGVVLAAAGTRDSAARSSVDDVATRLGVVLGVPVLAGYASGAGPTGAGAVALLRGLGCRRVVVSAYFLARGRLYDTVIGSAGSAGSAAGSLAGAGAQPLVGVAQPLGDAVELAGLVLDRVDSASRRVLLAAA